MLLVSASSAKKVHTLGDSTMAPYDEKATVTRGWGMYFGQFLTNGWTSINYAKGGRDSRGGYNELWQTAKKNVEAGDYVIITFGHNDEKINGMDRDEVYQYYVSKGMTTEAAALDSRGTTPSDTYKKWLGKIVDEIIERGATPIICSPVCRSYMDGNGKINRAGRHDLGDKFSILTADGIKENQKVGADDHTMDYAYHSEKLAEEKSVAFIDLTTATKNLYESYGTRTKCEAALFDGQGSTHFNTTGALLVARECARLMKAQGILADDIILPTDLSVSPATGDFGEAYKGQTLQKEFTINGFGLSPEEGTVTIEATEGIQLSFDKADWQQSLNVSYTAATLIKTFYAQMTLTQNGETTGTVTLRQGDKSIEIPVKATTVVLEGGAEVKAYWRLEKDDSYELTGPANVISESFQGMYVQRYSNPNAATVWPDWTGYDASRKMQRNLLTGDAWPADEIDDNPERYIQWGIKPSAGMDLKIDLISLFVSGCGGNGMCCHVYYSTDNFETRTTMFEMKKMPANNPQYVEAKPVLTVKDGEELLVRVYPWYNGAATGKTICLSDLTIHGVAVDAPKESVDEKNVTLSWPLGKGTDDATAAEVKTPGLFSVAEFDYGKMVISTQRAAATSQQTLYKPSNNNAGAANDDDALTFTIKPKKGLTFAPKTFAFEACRWGTNGGKFDVVAIAAGQETTIASAVTPERGNDGVFTAANYDLSNLTLDESGLVLKIKIYGLASNKEYGFGNVVVTGDIQGTPEAVPVYTMSVKLGTEGAGTVSCNPAGAEFDEGTTLTVTATENFGYHFTGWTDAEGNIISTENPYTFEIHQNTTLVAAYTKNTVYALNMKWTGGANENLIQFLPVGNYVDGVHYYEEGTDVKITALNNRILTFTGWEGDATGTASEYDIKMDSEKSVTANFSATDYIVGWDLYYDNPKSERAADYKADSENAGLLSLRNAAGETTSWLANGVAAGLMNGKYGARVWRPLTGNYYFEISFSSKGYENLKLSASVGDDYNAHSIIFAQYSTDGGQTFKTFGTYNLPNRGWDSQEFDLPTDAAGVDHLFIRFMPDYDSPMTGVESTYDGTAIADIFVLADATGAANEVATLVSSNPANKAIGVSRNGAVILNFDNKVKAGNGKATLNGEEIAPVISGKSAIFKYSGLAYNTAYTFSMPEGVLVSRSGKSVAAAELSFTTMERQQPEAKLYDAVVAQDGSGDYKTLQEAIDKAPAGRAKPWLIFVKNGRYNEHIDIPATKTHLHIIGQQRDKTVVYDNRLCGGDNAYSVDPGATVVVKGTDTFFENITLENSYGYEKLAGPQALALNTVADRVCMNNVALLSYQDTWITSSSSTARHYIKNSLIEGAVDFIYNNGDVYLDGDTIQINRPSGGYIVAPRHTASTKWGYVFQNNIIRPRKGIDVTDVWLGRPWHDQPKTVFINTQTFINIPAKGWYNTMGGLPALWAEYNTVDKDGNPVDLSQRETYYYYWIDKEAGTKAEVFNVKNTLTADEAAEYTIKNVCGGNDNWQPDLMCEACDAPVVKGEGSQLSWQAIPYAICYVITKNGEVVGFTKETSFDGYTTTDQWQVQAVNENGGLSAYGKANVSTGITHQPSSIFHQPSAIYTLDGRRTDSSARGLLIVRDSNGIARKVIR